MPLKLPLEVMREWDKEIDMDELECIIANLIQKEYIKGYIASEQQVLVTHKEIDKAYPSLI